MKYTVNSTLISSILMLMMIHHSANAGECKKESIEKTTPGCTTTHTYEEWEAYRKAGKPIPKQLFEQDKPNLLGSNIGLGAIKAAASQGAGSAPSPGGDPNNNPTQSSPFGDPLNQGGGGGGNGGDGGGGDPVGCADNDKPVQDPETGMCKLLGKEVPVSQNAGENKCGETVELSSEWLTLVKNPNAALIVKAGVHKLDAYTKTGSSLAYSKTSAIPSFYCTLIDGVPDGDGGWITPPTVQKNLIEPLGQFTSINNSSKIAAVSMKFPGGGQLGQEDFIIMTRKGTSLEFVPPKPNPEFFTALGAINVDPNCYTLDHLFSELPANFGDIRISNIESGYCIPDTYQPQTKGCERSLQYFDMDKMQLYMPSGSTAFPGKVSGGVADKLALLQPTAGSYTTGVGGGLIYDGPVAKITPGNNAYIGFGITNGADQAFSDGGSLIHDSGNVVRINSPGRFRVFSNGQVQLIDGGSVETTNGQFLRQIAANGSVQFNKDKPLEARTGNDIVFDVSNVVPTRQNNGQSAKALAALNRDDPCPAK